MLENSVYSVISPEGCASILWKDSSKASEAAAALKLTSYDLESYSIIEKIIYEKDRSPQEVCSDLKEFVTTEIAAKKSMSVNELLLSRYKKFRKIGEC